MSKNPRRTRGQAALEFLSTYGFAFLIILVMIGALSAFGVLNPSQLLPQRCLVGAEFGCPGGNYQLDASGSDVVLRVALINNLGNSLSFSTQEDTWSVSSPFHESATCTFEPDGGASVTGGGTSADTDLIAGGEVMEIECTLTDGTGFPSTGNKVGINFNFQYQTLGSRYPSRVDGEVFATIQE